MKNINYAKMLKDLITFGEYSRWKPPKLQENIDWFSDKESSEEVKTWDASLLVVRMKELVDKGASFKGLANAIVNTRRVELLNFALEHDLDLNEKNKLGNYCIQRALSRHSMPMVRAILQSNKFDINNIHTNGENIAFWMAKSGELELINNICKQNMDLLYMISDDKTVLGVAIESARGHNVRLDEIMDLANLYFSDERGLELYNKHVNVPQLKAINFEYASTIDCLALNKRLHKNFSDAIPKKDEVKKVKI